MRVNVTLSDALYKAVRREAEIMKVSDPEFIRHCVKVVVTLKERQRSKDSK